jgi:glutamate synthase domain-containing protein 3
VLTDYEDFRDNRCNLSTVLLENVDSDADMSELLELLELHHRNTGSTIAAELLENWPKSVKQFVKVMPTDYKRVLMERMELEVGG